jgi:hypothetical protein
MNEAAGRSVGGDTDTWMLFERSTEEGYPLIVLARTGNSLNETAWDSGIATVVHCVAESDLINDRGMPQHTDHIYPVEEGLARELTAFDVDALHVASVTGDGERKVVYVHRLPLNFDPIVNQFSVEGYRLQTGAVADKSSLRALVTPSALDHQLNGDLGVISNIEKNGDDGLTPRKTDFWFYGDIAALESLVTELGPWGFTVDHWLAEPEGVVLTCNSKVDYETFKEMTPILLAVAERHDVTYDGWETFIINPESAAAAPPEQPKPQSLLSRLFGARKN